MPLDLTPKEYDALWTEGGALRTDMQHRENYYRGKHAILRRDEKYSDGTQKKNRVANWVRYIADMYVGLLTATQYQVVSRDDDSETESVGPETYKEISEANALPRIDAKHLRTSFIKGRSVEVHGWNEGIGQIIQAHDPMEWYFALDDLAQTVAAIRKVTIAKGTIREGKPIADPVEVLTAYDEKTIRTFERTKKAQAEWTEQGVPKEHHFSRVPVLQMRLNDEYATYVNDALIGLCDEFNEIYSSAGDDIRRTVDALLAISGKDPDWILSHAQQIMETRVLPLSEQGEAEFLMRTSDTAPIKEQLQRTRDIIHIDGQVPDVQNIVGATGATSGIALQLQFMPMIRNAQAMIPYIKGDIMDRIALINNRLRMTNRMPIENIEVTVQVALPVNRIEEWQNIKALDGVVSHRKQLELLSDIGDPETELRRLQQEAKANASNINTPEQAAAVMDARVQQQTVTNTSDFKTLVSGLSAAVVDHMIASGAISKKAAA